MEWILVGIISRSSRNIGFGVGTKTTGMEKGIKELNACIKLAKGYDKNGRKKLLNRIGKVLVKETKRLIREGVMKHLENKKSVPTTPFSKGLRKASPTTKSLIDTQILLNSITYSLHGTEGVRIRGGGPKIPYAKVMQVGAGGAGSTRPTVTPEGNYLAVPLTKECRLRGYRGAISWPGSPAGYYPREGMRLVLKPIKTKGSEGKLLIEVRKGVKDDRGTPLFAFVKQIKIPARKYLFKSVGNSPAVKTKIKRIMSQVIRERKNLAKVGV